MDISPSLEGFFKDEVDRAFEDKHLERDTLTEHYLVQLLAAYAAQPIQQRPLALRMMEAINAAPRERRAQLRQIGDTSLYVSGFWSDSLSNKLVDVDYYIDMGGAAYGELSRGASWTGDPFGNVYGELAANFAAFVEVLMIVSRRTCRSQANVDILRLYERWVRTKSHWAARRLAAAGVVTPDPDGTVQ